MLPSRRVRFVEAARSPSVDTGLIPLFREDDATVDDFHKPDVAMSLPLLTSLWGKLQGIGGSREGSMNDALDGGVLKNRLLQ